MKLFITLILTLLFAGNLDSQKPIDHWNHIYYLTNDSGKEVAKRFDSGLWTIDSTSLALERMYQQKIEAEKKYSLVMEILKQLDQYGNQIDKKKYLTAVVNYNKYMTR